MKELRLKKRISWISFFVLFVLLGVAIFYFGNVYFNIFYFIVAMILMYFTSAGKPLNNYIYQYIRSR